MNEHRANILITGATGFIGRRLCHRLENEGNQIYAVVRKRSDKLSDSVIQICAEMSEYAQLDGRVSSRMDIGIMFAWAGIRGSDRCDAKLHQENVRNSVACLHSMHRAGCKTIVFAGTQMQYGPRYGEEPIKETDEPHPNTEYGKTKLAFSRYAEQYCMEHGLRYIEARIFSIYGEGDYEASLTMSLLKNMKQNTPCEMTQCIQLWDYLYVDDAAEMIARLINHTEADGVFHIASGIVKPLKEFVMRMYELTGSHSELRFGAIPYPPSGMMSINPSVEKLVNTIGEIELTTFDEGVARIFKTL